MCLEHSYEEMTEDKQWFISEYNGLVKLDVLSPSNRPFGKLKIHFTMLSTIQNVFGTTFWI